MKPGGFSPAVRRVPLVLLLLLCPCGVGTGRRGCRGVESQLLDEWIGEGVPTHGRRWNQVALKVLSNPNHLRGL